MERRPSPLAAGIYLFWSFHLLPRVVLLCFSCFCFLIFFSQYCLTDSVVQDRIRSFDTLKTKASVQRMRSAEKAFQYESEALKLICDRLEFFRNELEEQVTFSLAHKRARSFAFSRLQLRRKRAKSSTAWVYPLMADLPALERARWKVRETRQVGGPRRPVATNNAQRRHSGNNQTDYRRRRKHTEGVSADDQQLEGYRSRYSFIRFPAAVGRA